VKRGIHLAVISFIVIFSGSTTWAATERSDRDLTLAPLRTELSVAPGTSVEGVMKMTNRTSANMEVKLSSEVFNVINEQYDYAFDKDSETAKWIRFSEDAVKLSPGEERSVDYQLAAPLKAEPGGRYISLFASADTQSDVASVPSRQRVASLLYVTVQGDVSRTGQFLGLEVPWFTSKDPSWSTRIRNSGTTHFRSRYSVEMKSLSGQIVSEQREDALILPGTVRLVSDTLQMPKLPGLYRIDYKIGLGDSPSHRETKWMIYSPPLATALVVAVIVISAVAIHIAMRRRSIHSGS